MNQKYRPPLYVIQRERINICIRAGLIRLLVLSTLSVCGNFFLPKNALSQESDSNPRCNVNQGSDTHAACRIETPGMHSLGWAGTMALTNAADATVLLDISSTMNCTGTLIATNPRTNFTYILTAAHCFSSNVQGTSITISRISGKYRRPLCSSSSANRVSLNNKKATLVHLNHEKDTALLLLEVSADTDFLTYYRAEVDPRDFVPSELDFSPHHPSGAPLRLHNGIVSNVSSPFNVGGTAIPVNDTVTMKWGWFDGVSEPVSSGAGVFSILDGRLVLRATTLGSYGKNCDDNGFPTLTGLIVRETHFAKVKNSYPDYKDYLTPTSSVNVSITGTDSSSLPEIQLHRADGSLIEKKIASQQNSFTVYFNSVEAGDYYSEAYLSGVRISLSPVFHHNRSKCHNQDGTANEYDCRLVTTNLRLVANVIQPSPNPSPPAPLISSPVNGATIIGTSLELHWNSVNGAEAYSIGLRDQTTNTLVSIPLITGTTYVASVIQGHSYTWDVASCSSIFLPDNGANCPNRQSNRNFQVASNGTLPAPILLAPSDGVLVADATVSLSWQAVAGAESYRIVVARDIAALQLQPSDATCPSTCVINIYTDNANPFFQLDKALLANGGTYYWAVKARGLQQVGNISVPRRLIVGQSQCSFGFAQTSLFPMALGGTFSIGFSSQPWCSAAVLSNQSYCTVSPTAASADMSGQGVLSFTVLPNGPGARNCTITLGNATMVVSQPANSPGVSYSLTLNQATGGTATVTPNATSFAAGTTLYLNATPDSGYNFSGWQDSGTIVSTGTSYAFSIHGNRTLTPVFSSTQVAVTGIINPNANLDQKWRVLGNGLTTNTWQSNGENIGLQSGTSYRIDCADTPYYQPSLNTFNFIPGSNFTCSYVAKAQQAFSPSLPLVPQPRVASGVSNSLARLDDGRVVIWGLSKYTDFPNYSANSEQLGTPLLLRPLFLPIASDAVGVSIGPNMINGMFILSSTGSWKRWGNAATSAIRVPTVEPSLSGFVKMSGNVGLKSDGTVWYINQTGVNTPVATLSDIVDIAWGSYMTIALRKDGAVISLTDPGNGLPCLVAGISSFVNASYQNCTPPVALPGINRVVSIAVAKDNAYAIRDDGTVWFWGIGTLTGGVTVDPNNYAPTQIPAITGAVQVVASSSSTVVYVRTNNNQIFAWGANALGQLGRGTTTSSEPDPQLIGGMNNIVELGQTDGSSLLAIDSSGFVWTVGVAASVGNGSSVTTQSIPVKVSCPNGYVGDLNLTTFSSSCVSAPSNSLNISDLSPSIGKQVLVNGIPVTLPFSQSYAAGTQVTLTTIPDVGNGFTRYRGDLYDTQSRARTLVLNRDWNISVDAFDCSTRPGNSAVIVNGSNRIPVTASAIGGAQIVNVDTDTPHWIDQCHWGFFTTNTWIQANADGFGPSSFSLNIAPNPSNVQRIGNFKVGGPSGYDIQVTQAASPTNAIPEAFSFISLIGAPLSSVTQSNAIAVSGINTATNITVTGGEFSIGCTASFTSAAAAVNSGDIVCVRHATSASANTSVTTTLNIGGISGTFTSTTAGPPLNYLLTVSKLGTGTGTVTSNLGGINCGALCTANISAGTLVSLNSAPATGSTFVGWSGGGCAGTGTCPVTMSSAWTVYANFSALTAPSAPSITNISAGHGNAIVTFSAPVNTGGSAITGYTVTCTAVNHPTRTGGRAGSPIKVLGLIGGVSYSCSVIASNGTWSSAPSIAMFVTPMMGGNITSILMLLLD